MDDLIDLEDRGVHVTGCTLALHCCGDDCRSYGCDVDCDCYYEDGKSDVELDAVRSALRDRTTASQPEHA